MKNQLAADMNRLLSHSDLLNTMKDKFQEPIQAKLLNSTIDAKSN